MKSPKVKIRALTQAPHTSELSKLEICFQQNEQTDAHLDTHANVDVVKLLAAVRVSPRSWQTPCRLLSSGPS